MCYDYVNQVEGHMLKQLSGVGVGWVCVVLKSRKKLKALIKSPLVQIAPACVVLKLKEIKGYVWS